MNGSRLAEQGPSSGRCSRQGNIGRHHANPVISKRRKWTNQENKIVMECFLLSEPKIRGYRKRMLSLWLQKGMFWVSEQRLVDQAHFCNLTLTRRFWVTTVYLRVSKISKICLLGCPTGRATSWKANFENFYRCSAWAMLLFVSALVSAACLFISKSCDIMLECHVSSSG